MAHVCFMPVAVTVLACLSSRLLFYSAGSAVNRVQVIWSGFSMRLLWFLQTKTLYMYGSMYFLDVFVLVDMMTMSSA